MSSLTWRFVPVDGWNAEQGDLHSPWIHRVARLSNRAWPACVGVESQNTIGAARGN
jgi:hypothetical protein